MTQIEVGKSYRVDVIGTNRPAEYYRVASSKYGYALIHEDALHPLPDAIDARHAARAPVDPVDELVAAAERLLDEEDLLAVDGDEEYHRCFSRVRDALAAVTAARSQNPAAPFGDAPHD